MDGKSPNPGKEAGRCNKVQNSNSGQLLSQSNSCHEACQHVPPELHLQEGSFVALFTNVTQLQVHLLEKKHIRIASLPCRCLSNISPQLHWCEQGWQICCEDFLCPFFFLSAVIWLLLSKKDYYYFINNALQINRITDGCLQSGQLKSISQRNIYTFCPSSSINCFIQ